MANGSTDRKQYNTDIVIEYRNTATVIRNRLGNSQHIKVKTDGSVIDLTTSLCYSSLDEWYTSITN